MEGGEGMGTKWNAGHKASFLSAKRQKRAPETAPLYGWTKVDWLLGNYKTWCANCQISLIGVCVQKELWMLGSERGQGRQGKEEAFVPCNNNKSRKTRKQIRCKKDRKWLTCAMGGKKEKGGCGCLMWWATKCVPICLFVVLRVCVWAHIACAGDFDDRWLMVLVCTCAICGVHSKQVQMWMCACVPCVPLCYKTCV